MRKGSTFEVRIPLSRTPTDKETLDARLPSLQSDARQRRVLVVEDNEDIRESSCDLLAMAGFEVTGVSTSTEAGGAKRTLKKRTRPRLFTLTAVLFAACQSSRRPYRAPMQLRPLPSGSARRASPGSR